MRTIKFRGKRTDNSEWVYGYLLECESGECLICDAFDKSSISQYQVFPDTVGQFTGLTDKNGKEIWEGDIVMFYETKMVVIFDDDAAFKAKSTQGVGIAYPLYDDDQKIVIGNIHDNPELLK